MTNWHLFWQQRSLVNRALLPLSWLYGGISAIRRQLLQLTLAPTDRLPVPVVIAGSINSGGAGKTPLAEALAIGLRERGRKPGLILRGHGGRRRLPHLIDRHDQPADCGDEALMLAAHLAMPVAIGRDRPAAGRVLLASHPETDVIISDDGLQHYRLGREVELVALGPKRLGNGWLLPAGPLREPPRRLRECDAVIIKDAPTEAHEHSLRLIPIALRPLTGGSDLDWAEIKGRSITAVAGIGDPGSFFSTLIKAGLTVQHQLVFPDHHLFRSTDLASLPGELIVLSGKDAVKCRLFDEPRLHELLIRPEVDATLLDLVVDLINARKAT